MKANGKVTSAELRLAAAIRKRALPGGSAPLAAVAELLGQPVQQTARTAESGMRHGITVIYTYMGERRLALSDQGWDITERSKR